MRLLVVPGDEAFGPEGLPVGLIEEKCFRHLKNGKFQGNKLITRLSSALPVFAAILKS